MVIDSHQHFWKYHPVRNAWITDDMKVIQRDFLPEDLMPIYENLGINGCVAVQADQSEEETNFLLKLASENDFIKGVVGWVDLKNPKVDERLQHLSENRFLKGIRHIVQDETANFVLDPKFQNGISKLRKWGLTYDVLIYPNQLKYATKLVAKFEDTKFVIDHMAKPYIKNGEIERWKKDMETMAQHENVHCKLSGFVTEADWTQRKYEDFVPYLDVVFENFGSDRILFGSDWPVCLLAAEYTEVFKMVSRYLEKLRKNESEAVLGLNAIHFYDL